MNRAPQLNVQTDDIQAVLGTGFGWLHSSKFMLISIENPDEVRDWLQQLLRGPWLKSMGELNRCEGKHKEIVKEVAAIAFTYAGIKKIGLTEKECFPFSTAFRSGMGSELRRELLRDDPRTEWRWTDQEHDSHACQTVHMLVACWWKKGSPSTLPAVRGARDLRRIMGNPASFAKGFLEEPFGFREGISQPKIYGLKGDLGDEPEPLAPGSIDKMERDHVVAPGEFIMGYRNEYEELSYCADVVAWPGAKSGAHFALNGSYLAIRQMEQHVDAFKRMEEAIPATLTQCPLHASVGEKMMGRKYDGTPLAAQAKGTTSLNSFRYRVEDENGFVTPRGAHIRRANPRDTLGHDVQSGIMSSKLHRLLRRGRPYVETADAGDRVGTFFVACNADLERQFEFVFQRWLRNSRFADLEHEDDPFVGHPTSPRTFTAPGLPIGKCLELKTFTTTLGGGYFFLPGLCALRFIAKLEDGAKSEPRTSGVFPTA